MPETERTLRSRKAPRKLKSEPWYQGKGEEAARSAWKFAEALYTKQGQERREWANDCLALYEGNAARELGLVAASVWGVDPATFNAVGACVDTRASHVYRNKVRPFFLTQRGNWEQREKARCMQMAVEGTFHSSGIWGELGQHVCWDGEVFEAGCVKVTPDYANSRVLVERLSAQEVYFDKRDARLGKPTQCVVYTTIDRAKLLDFCKGASEDVIDAILEAPPAPEDMYEEDDDLGESETSDRIVVAELWHLPSGRVDRSKDDAWKVGKLHDGRHMIVIGGAKESVALHDEAWPYDYFPIAFYRPKKRRRGFWSQSIPERLVGAQLSINRMLRRVDGIMNLHARPLVYLNKQAKVNADKITNSWASIIEGNGPASSAIQYITPQSVPAEYIAQIQRIISWCFEQEGISELSASAKKPAGIEAAVAIQALQDTESIRHTDVFRAWEDFHIDLSRMIVDAFRLLAESGADLDLTWGDSKELKRFNWGDADLSESLYHLMVWPTNLLPQTPSARLQRVIEMMREKLISTQQGLMLLEFPDIEAMTGDSNAVIRNIEEKLNAITRGDDSLKAMPHTYLQLEMALQQGVDRLNRIEADGAPEDVLDLLRQWIEDVKALRDAAAPPQPTAPPPTPPTPPAPAAPPPPPALPMAA